MLERSRFEPARDARGKPVPDQVTARVAWRIPKDPPSRGEAIVTLWATCLAGETAKLATSDLSAEEVVARSFPQCRALEALVSQELGEKAVEELRTNFTNGNKETVEHYREAFNSPPTSATPDEP
jgi:hypothetical protein